MVRIDDGSQLRIILFAAGSSNFSAATFACGFYCNGDCNSYIFGIFTVITSANNESVNPKIVPELVWSGNRNKPVGLSSSLQFTSQGGLILLDENGYKIWWTELRGGKSIGLLTLTEKGNLMLLGKFNESIVLWQSFDYPTDTLVFGQNLTLSLRARVSQTNWSDGGLFSVSLSFNGLCAFIASTIPAEYYFGYLECNSRYPDYINASRLVYNDGRLLVQNATSGTYLSGVLGSYSIPKAHSLQFIRLEYDGHLKVYDLVGDAWKEVADVFSNHLDDCDYPMVCGNNGICSNNGSCKCPESVNGTGYFKQEEGVWPGSFTCSAITPLTCEASSLNRTHFVEVRDVTYSHFEGFRVGDYESCKEDCLRNCSCKAVVFSVFVNTVCYFPTQVFSLKSNYKRENIGNSSVYLKVQERERENLPQKKERKRGNQLWIKLVYSIGAFVGLFVFIAAWLLLFSCRKKRNTNDDVDGVDNLERILGVPYKFSYKDLKSVTKNFTTKLGEGGFGCVFEGCLSDGTRIAVKCLDGMGHIKKSFFSEVESIGRIHHVNLVRLIGFCTEKSHRLLVYECMCNGSLDKWIFQKGSGCRLDWKQRRKIIVDIAKGLSYLHDACNQKIVHMDIKPENILLDANFNAKVSDFGLAKLVERDQSKFVTNMRGTIGYLAPEWLSSEITEKVDVYSFGVVLLEILCGRRNLDRSLPENAMHLLGLFKIKLEEGQVSDLADHDHIDMQEHGKEVVNLMNLAAWCLHSDFSRRPSMSLVVYMLENGRDFDFEQNFDFSRSIARVSEHEAENVATSTPVLPSILSGPR